MSLLSSVQDFEPIPLRGLKNLLCQKIPDCFQSLAWAGVVKILRNRGIHRGSDSSPKSSPLPPFSPPPKTRQNRPTAVSGVYAHLVDLSLQKRTHLVLPVVGFGRQPPNISKKYVASQRKVVGGHIENFFGSVLLLVDLSPQESTPWALPALGL